MFYLIFRVILLCKFTLSLSKEAELPLCPTNVLYFPQNLPMHCRMPTNADYPRMSVPSVPPFFQSPPPDKQPLPIPFPIPPGLPGPMPVPGNMPAPGPIPVPGPIPIPMTLPGGPAHKLPVIVMPFYSPDPSFKKTERPNLPFPHRPRKWRIRHRRRRPYLPSDTSSSSDTDISSDTSSSSSSENRGWWKDRRNRRRFNRPNKMKRIEHHNRQLLTPILQYVTKDGYVIFEKKISKNEAKDWMSIKKEARPELTTRPTSELIEDSNEHNSREKEIMTKGNVEVLTKRNSHRLNRIKAFKDKKRT